MDNTVLVRIADTTATPAKVQIRTIMRVDRAEISQIDFHSYEPFWCPACVERAMHRPGMHCAVAIDSMGMVIGYIFFAIKKLGAVEVARLAVHPDRRGEGIGRQLVAHLTSHREPGGLKVAINICEYHTAAQRFLKRCGFRAVGVLRGFWNADNRFEESLDAIRFVFFGEA